MTLGSSQHCSYLTVIPHRHICTLTHLHIIKKWPNTLEWNMFWFNCVLHFSLHQLHLHYMGVSLSSDGLCSLYMCLNKCYGSFSSFTYSRFQTLGLFLCAERNVCTILKDKLLLKCLTPLLDVLGNTGRGGGTFVWVAPVMFSAFLRLLTELELHVSICIDNVQKSESGKVY